MEDIILKQSLEEGAGEIPPEETSETVNPFMTASVTTELAYITPDIPVVTVYITLENSSEAPLQDVRFTAPTNDAIMDVIVAHSSHSLQMERSISDEDRTNGWINEELTFTALHEGEEVTAFVRYELTIINDIAEEMVEEKLSESEEAA